MNKSISIAALTFSTKDAKVLEQIWREQFPDCSSLEEVTRRLALKGVIKELAIQRSFNVYRKMRKTKNIDEILQILRDKNMDWETVKKQTESQVESE